MVILIGGVSCTGKNKDYSKEIENVYKWVHEQIQEPIAMWSTIVNPIGWRQGENNFTPNS